MTIPARVTANIGSAALAVLATVVGVGSPSPAASAVSTSAASDRANITAATVKVLAREARVPAREIRVTTARVSTVNPAYGFARAKLRTVNTDDAEVLLTKVGRTWRVVTYGTGGFGCDESPPSVTREFGVYVNDCNPGDRFYVEHGIERRSRATSTTDLCEALTGSGRATYVTRGTTCAFASNVEDRYNASTNGGSSRRAVSFTAMSPQTGLTYRARCSAASDARSGGMTWRSVRCESGKNYRAQIILDWRIY